jgi:hypothetical protein
MKTNKKLLLAAILNSTLIIVGGIVAYLVMLSRSQKLHAPQNLREMILSVTDPERLRQMLVMVINLNDSFATTFVQLTYSFVSLIAVISFIQIFLLIKLLGLDE